jgi:hypothetical protein
MAMEALGRTVDVALGSAPVDLSAAATTGKRLALRDAAGVTIVVVKGAGAAGENPTFTLQQHTAAAGGVSQALPIVDHYYLKSAAVLAGTEQWVKVTQTVAATIADPGGAGTSGQSQQILAVEVAATSLADGFKYVSLNISDVGSAAQIGAVLYLLRDLDVQRAPEKLAPALA